MIAGRHALPMVAGSDSHYAKTVGLRVTSIETEDDDGVIQAICSGRTRIEGHRTPPRLFVGYTFKYIYKKAKRR